MLDPDTREPMANPYGNTRHAWQKHLMVGQQLHAKGIAQFATDKVTLLRSTSDTRNNATWLYMKTHGHMDNDKWGDFKNETRRYYFKMPEGR